eukprot:COSAG01_NODE_3718_length_5767_cov_3.219125_2_plen_456_part_00
MLDIQPDSYSGIDQYLIEMIDQCEIMYTFEKIDGAHERVWKYKRRGFLSRPWQAFSASTQQELNDRMRGFENGGDEEFRLVSLAVVDWTLDINLEHLSAREVRLVPRGQLIKLGDIERMARVFAAARDFQREKPMTRWKEFFPEWEEFFPDQDRHPMYAWAPIAGKENIDDMCWFMQELTDMYDEQHRLRPCDCCGSGREDEDEKASTITRPQWLRQTEQEIQQLASSTSNKKRLTVGEGYTIVDYRARMSRAADGIDLPAATRQDQRDEGGGGGGGGGGSDDGGDDDAWANMRQSQRFRRLQRKEMEAIRREQAERSALAWLKRLQTSLWRMLLGTMVRATIFGMWVILSLGITIFFLVRWFAVERSEDSQCRQIRDHERMGRVSKWEVWLGVYWLISLCSVPLVLLVRRVARSPRCPRYCGGPAREQRPAHTLQPTDPKDFQELVRRGLGGHE